MSKSIAVGGMTQFTPSKPLISGASAPIDWATGNVFTDTITSGKTYTFNNAIDGRTIIVRIRNTTGSNLSIVWPGAVVNQDTIVPANSTKLFTLVSILGTIYMTSVSV